MIERLPSCEDIERLVLGYAILNSGTLDSMRGSLQPDDFSIEAHKRIWRAICRIYDAGEQVDRVTVYHDLKARDQAESVGGLSYLVTLDNGLPDRPNIDGYVSKLHETAMRRQIISSAYQLALHASDETSGIEDLLSELTAISSGITEVTEASRPFSTKDMIAKEGINELLKGREEKSIRLPWHRLNGALRGLGGGQMVVLMAATSRGKTSLAVQIATSAAVQGHTPAMWTMEMSPRSLFQKMATQLAGQQICEQMTFEERSALTTSVARLNDYPIYFDSHSRDVGSFIASLRYIRSRGNLGIAVVDYLQLIRGNRARNRAQEVSDNSRALKLASMDLGIPFLVLSQVDRSSVKGDGKMGLHSAKESGDIENDADVMIWIDSGEFSHEEDTDVKIHIGKQREGPAGFSIPMKFRPQSQSFAEISE